MDCWEPKVTLKVAKIVHVGLGQLFRFCKSSFFQSVGGLNMF